MRALSIFVITAALAMTVQAQVQTTAISGTAYKSDGSVAAFVPVTIVKVLKSGVVVSTQPVTVRTNSSGAISFNVLRNSTAYIYAPGVVGFERAGGVPVTIPDASSATFESLVPIVNVPSSNLTVHAALRGSTTVFGHLKCGSGVTCTDGVISSSGGGASALDDLSDVVITGATSGEYLRHNGTAFVDASIAAGDLPTGIDAAKLADGTVSNAELQRLDGVTSAIQTQLDAKAAAASLAAHIADTANPHATTKAQVGLSNVDNTSDTNKPISTATQTALDAKQNLDSDLTAVAGLAANGLVARTGTGTAAARTVAAGSSKVTVSNGDGVAGNPTVDVAEAQLTLSNLGGSVTDAQVPNSITVDLATLATTATTANAGDSATAFFSTGTIETARLGSGTADNTTFLRGDQTWAVPTGGGDVTLTGTQTLTNKTLTAPKLADLGFIADANGNELIIGDTVASAVNEITVANAATGTGPTISATGGDTNIDLNLRGKGTGGVKFGAASTGIVGLLDTDATHYLNLTPGSNLTADRTFTLTTGDAARTLNMGGNITTAADFITSGANSLTLTTTGSTNVTLPTTGTLMANPMTTQGDIIYGGASGTPTRLAAGATAGHVLTSNGSGAAPSWQAVSGGSSSLGTDAYWYPVDSLTGAGQGTTANGVRVHRECIAASLTVNAVVWYLNAAGGAGSKVGIGVYSSDGNTLLIDADNQAGDAATGAKTVALGAPVTLTAGCYWFAVSSSDINTEIYGVNVGATLSGIRNADTTQGGDAANSMSSGQLPATLGSISAGTHIRWHVKLQN